MKLYGSTTSPFVRRLRIYLADKSYEFENVAIFGADRDKIKATNPTLKIPMFEDLDNPECPTLIDSGNIHAYLANKFGDEALTYEQQNLMVILNACNDSLVNMLVLDRSGVDTSADNLYFNIQRERNKETFDYLEQAVLNGLFDEWNYVSISLLVLVDWAQFRNLFDFTHYPNLVSFVGQNYSRPKVEETAPRD